METTCRATLNRFLVAGLVGITAIAPASAQAAAHVSTFRYDVKVTHGILASGSTVEAVATVRDADARVKQWWSARTITTVVRKGVNNGYQEPYSSEGYRCTPSVRAQNTRFDCTLRGADVATTVALRYSVRYRAR